MLKNFIQDTDLKKFHPNLARQVWTSQSDYSTQIDEAFHIVLTDLNNKEINARQVMIPFDLLSSGSTANFVMTTTKTTNALGSGMQAGQYGRNYKRLVSNVTSVTGTWSLSAEGSNDNVNFEYAGATLTASAVGENSTVYDNQYRYWRYNLHRTSTGGSDSITFSAYLVEDVWDRLIIYKTFELIFSDLRKEQNDSWDLLVQSYQRKYENELSAIKYLFDADDSGVIQDGEEADNKYYLTL